MAHLQEFSLDPAIGGGQQQYFQSVRWSIGSTSSLQRRQEPGPAPAPEPRGARTSQQRRKVRKPPRPRTTTPRQAPTPTSTPGRPTGGPAPPASLQLLPAARLVSRRCGQESRAPGGAVDPRRTWAISRAGGRTGTASCWWTRAPSEGGAGCMLSSAGLIDTLLALRRWS